MALLKVPAAELLDGAPPHAALLPKSAVPTALISQIDEAANCGPSSAEGGRQGTRQELAELSTVTVFFIILLLLRLLQPAPLLHLMSSPASSPSFPRERSCLMLTAST